jgi:hypothetical protein
MVNMSVLPLVSTEIGTHQGIRNRMPPAAMTKDTVMNTRGAA